MAFESLKCLSGRSVGSNVIWAEWHWFKWHWDASVAGVLVPSKGPWRQHASSFYFKELMFCNSLILHSIAWKYCFHPSCHKYLQNFKFLVKQPHQWHNFWGTENRVISGALRFIVSGSLRTPKEAVRHSIFPCTPVARWILGLPADYLRRVRVSKPKSPSVLTLKWHNQLEPEETAQFHNHVYLCCPL